MKNPKANSNEQNGRENIPGFENLPAYIPEIGNESGHNYKIVEIKSHSFPVRNPHHLASENIIFEPEGFRIIEK